MNDIDLMKATPGSDYAVESGCLCPVMDNCRGRGYMGIDDQFWINAQCPLHGDLSDDSESS